MDESRFEQLETLLRRRGIVTAAEIARELDVSQAGVSRLVAAAGERIVRIGKARASRYALAHPIARAGSRWPLYRIEARARPEKLGELQALHNDAFLFEPARPLPAFLEGDFGSGLFPGLPWFLDDQRPQGFLGRAFGRRIAADIGARDDIVLWHSDDIVLGLLRHGEDQAGDLVLGEATLQRALRDIQEPRAVFPARQRAKAYPQLADIALRGESIGSSAGGEQPKFTATLRSDDGYKPVIVKFSDRVTTRAGRRWADLLICEHLAGETLREHGLPAAISDIVEADGRVFLESTRFDRTPELGRRGFVSFAALDAGYYGHGRIDWWRFASELARDGWLNADDAMLLRRLSWFGELIANSDMHLGNAALQLVDARPLPLAPAYDMLPMTFRPLPSGEVVEREYVVVQPLPEHREDWRIAAEAALAFWRDVADETRISAGFRSIARDASAKLKATAARA
ncbi:MAG: type II toxin-antitoxin system HipA family toxin YjjJ [Rudaea sp.]|nr:MULTISPECIES: type II toxin-antitoxin system HipA family toxin YjjJ [unclassified Rudaea]MBN8886929.1 type II toxin-antitoxin system HipA family toxin YjjJ [Rudaea sp.]MBR0346933.1 type II toxin-antitoxin system HipA family toxin YjjJ [Rudaea sp.]